MNGLNSSAHKRVLLVDDDDAFRTALKSLLSDQGFDVTLATGGKAAQNLIGVESFDAVLTDIRMPQGNGIELLHFIKRTKPMPVILMTGFAELTETKEAFELGADEFIAKPFKREDLVEALKVCTGADKEQLVKELSADDFCKLNIDDFVTGREIQFDIYVRLGSEKFVKIAHQGEDLSTDRIKAYKEKNIKCLYMRKEDFRKYVGFNISLAQTVVASSKVNKIKKLNFLKHTNEVILEHIYTNDIDKETFEQARDMLEATVSVMGDSRELFDLLKILNNHSDSMYAHALGTSLYAVLIARQLHWNSPMTMFKLSMGGLLHDIGEKEIDRAILQKPRKDLEKPELKLIESHPVRGAEILGKVTSVPSDVLQIVLQHHENNLGLGYPSGLKKNHIHPMARVVAVASAFCDLTIKSSTNPGLPPHEAIARMLALHRETLDPEPFAALLKVFRIPLPPDFQEGRRK